MRNASHAEEGSGKGGQRCHQPRGAISERLANAMGHNKGRCASAVAGLDPPGSVHRVSFPVDEIKRPASAASSGKSDLRAAGQAEPQKQAISCGCRSATANGGASRKARHPCRSDVRNRERPPKRAESDCLAWWTKTTAAQSMIKKPRLPRSSEERKATNKSTKPATKATTHPRREWAPGDATTWCSHDPQKRGRARTASAPSRGGSAARLLKAASSPPPGHLLLHTVNHLTHLQARQRRGQRLTGYPSLLLNDMILIARAAPGTTRSRTHHRRVGGVSRTSHCEGPH